MAREIVALGGKALRRAGRRGQSPRYLVSAWAQRNGLELGQLKVADKRNEITALPQLSRALERAGCLVAVDAMGCQKTIAQEIIEAGADYVLALKGNQEPVHDEVKTYLDDALVPAAQAAARKTKGKAKAFPELAYTEPVERRCYLSSLARDAEPFARAVRGHWSVENSLHWCLDVQVGEDQSRARTGHAAETLATLRRLALNLLKRDKTKQRGLRGKQLNAGWNHDYLLRLPAF